MNSLVITSIEQGLVFAVLDMDLFLLIQKHSITTIMISHDIRDAIEFSDRIIMLDKDKVIFDKSSINVTERELIKIYQDKFDEMVA